MHRKDPSTGDLDKIFDLNIYTNLMDRVLVSPNMNLEDTDEFFESAPDLTSLPGKILSVLAGSAGSESNIVEVVDAIQGALQRRKIERVGKRDNDFRRYGGHAFAEIKDETSLRAIVTRQRSSDTANPFRCP